MTNFKYSNELTGTQNLWVALREQPISPERDIEKGDIPKLFEALDTLAVREREIIKRYFGISCERERGKALADNFGVTDERVRQIKCRALRKLQHPSRMRWIELLYASSEELRESIREAEIAEKSLSEENRVLKGRLEKLDKMYQEARNEIAVLKGRPARPIVANTGVALLELDIDEMGFSNRVLNCLKRIAGMKTVSELCQRTEKDIGKIRFLGRRSLEEIKYRLEELGLSLAEGDGE